MSPAWKFGGYERVSDEERLKYDVIEASELPSNDMPSPLDARDIDELAECLWRLDGCPDGGASDKHRDIAASALGQLGKPN